MRTISDSKRVIWSLAWPSSIVFFMSTVSSAFITRIVSELGTPQIAAVTTGLRINFFVVAILMGMAVATTALVSRSWGAKDSDLAIESAKLSIRIGLIICILLSLTAVALARPLVDFFNLDYQSAEYAIGYIRWLSIFIPSQCIILIIGTASRAVGDAKSPLYFAFFANSLGVLGAYLLTFGVADFPELGITGTAIGWGIGYTIIAFVYLFYWLSGRLALPYKWKIKEKGISPYRFSSICMPSILEQLITQGSMIVFVSFIGVYGTAYVAAYGIGINLFLLTIVIGIGFSVASSTLVGQALGANDPELAQNLAKKSVILAFISMCITGGLSAIYAHELASLMVSDKETAELATAFIVAVAIIQPMLAIDLVLGGAMKGAGHTGFPLFAGLVSILGIRLPLAAFITELGYSINWVYVVFVVDHFVKTLLIVWRYQSKAWLKQEPINQTSAINI